MKISEIYKNKKRSLSFEIFPPKKDDELRNIDDTLAVLCELKPDFISVTFGAGGSSNSNRTIELARKIKDEYKVEPVVHLTGLHYDKEEIDEFARVMKEEGIENILALRGDRTPKAVEKNTFKHSTDLIAYLKSKYDFCLLGACYPECHPESENKVSELKCLKSKVDAGAEVLLSQLFFSNETFYRFYESCRIADINVPVIPGIMPITNANQVERAIKLSGSFMPQRFKSLVDYFGNDPEAMKQAGIAYATDQIIDLYANGITNVHVYSMNKPDVAKTIMENLSNILGKDFNR